MLLVKRYSCSLSSVFCRARGVTIQL